MFNKSNDIYKKTYKYYNLLIENILRRLRMTFFKINEKSIFLLYQLIANTK